MPKSRIKPADADKANTFKPIVINHGPAHVRITQINSKTATGGKLYRIKPAGGGKPIHRADY